MFIFRKNATKPKTAKVEKEQGRKLIIDNNMDLAKLNQESNMEEVQFDSEAVKIEEFEERNEMLVIWRRGDGFFPDLLK